MAKREVADQMEQAVTTMPTASMPAEMMEDAAQYAGAGVSERQDDFLLPFLMIAQANSPQLKRQQTDKYIEGLRDGDIFNTATREIYRSEEGVLVLQTFFQKAMVEWVLRDEGGGWIAQHVIDTPLLRQARWGGEDNRFLLLPNGHQLIDTSYHFVTLAETGQAAVASMTSTSLATSRMWQTLMKEVKVAVQGQLHIAPCFSRVYRLRTAYKSKGNNSWYIWTVSDEGWAIPKYRDAYDLAKKSFVYAQEHGVRMGRPPESTWEGDAPVTVDQSADVPI
jgi:hypothetical protein